MAEGGQESKGEGGRMRGEVWGEEREAGGVRKGHGAKNKM